MIVLYLKESNRFLQAIKGFPEVKEEGNKLLLASGKVIINDLTKAGYREYPDQEFELPTEWNEELEELVELPITLEELNLRDFEEGEPKPSADRDRAEQLLSSSPAVITQPEMWELLRILGRKVGYRF